MNARRKLNFENIKIKYFDKKANRSAAAFQGAVALVFFALFSYSAYDYLARYEHGIYIGKILFAVTVFIIFLAAFANLLEIIKYTPVLASKETWKLSEFALKINKNEIKAKAVITAVLSAGFELAEESYLSESD